MDYLSSYLGVRGSPSSDGGGPETRQFDIVVWGATGFTGRLVCAHLARHGGCVRWAVGGRRPGALSEVVEAFAAAPCGPRGVVRGDALDGADCTAVARSSRLVLSCSGPYAAVGSQLVAACARAGTHYVDITGETVPFVRDSIAANDGAARASGACVVHCCGYDSVPSDVLAALAIEAVSQEEGERCERCVVSCDAWRTVGTASGGTLASALGLLAHLSRRPSDIPAALDPLVLAGPTADANPIDEASSESRLPPVWRRLADHNDAPNVPGYDPLLGEFHAGFVMAACNTKVVRRTRHLLGDVGAGFRYTEVLGFGPGLLSGLVASVAASVALGLAGICLLFPPVRWAVALVAPPGSGPSPAERRAGRWRFDVAARGDHGAVARGAVVAVGQDPASDM